MSQSLWTCLGGVHHQIKGGQGRAKAKAGGTQPNLKRTPDQANHPTSESVTTATSPGTSLGNAERPSKLGTGKHIYRTTLTRTRIFHTYSRRYTPPIC